MCKPNRGNQQQPQRLPCCCDRIETKGMRLTLVSMILRPSAPAHIRGVTLMLGFHLLHHTDSEYGALVHFVPTRGCSYAFKAKRHSNAPGTHWCSETSPSSSAIFRRI